MKTHIEDVQDLFEARARRGYARGADAVLAAARVQATEPPVVHRPDRSADRPILALVAAVVVAGLAVMGLWALVPSADTSLESTSGDPTDELEAAPSDDDEAAPDDRSDQPPVDAAAVTSAEQSLPFLVLDQPGFRITGGHQRTVAWPPGEGGELWAYQEPDAGPAGPSLTLRPADQRWRTEAGESVLIGDVEGSLETHGRLTGVQWPINGTDWLLLGIDVDQDALLEAAASVRVDGSGQPTPVERLAGLNLIGHGAASGQGTVEMAEFGFETDAHQGDILIASGGFYEYWSEVLDLASEAENTLTTLAMDRLALVMDRGSETWGAAVWPADGFVFTIRGSMPPEELAGLAGSVRVVDETEWLTVVPDEWVAAADLPDEVAAIVSDIPIPPGFDMAEVVNNTDPGDPYQLTAEVTGAVTCTWIDRWVEGREAGNQAMVGEAAAALAGAPEWDALIRIAGEGGWSSVVWEYAEAVNGDGMVMGGVELTVEESYQEALGCDRWS